jgi:hypothetical protein
VALLLGSGYASAADPDALAPLVVSTVRGEVHATTAGHVVALKAGSRVGLPLSLSVGADGLVELHQGLTLISAGANAHLEIPKSQDKAETLEKLIQSQGNVYYSVAKRPDHKLRVETPYLVAVIKGTRFNVSASATSSTVALLEGSIEIHGAVGEVIDLQAGEIALRSRANPSVRVIEMTTGTWIRHPGSAGGPGVSVPASVKFRAGATGPSSPIPALPAGTGSAPATKAPAAGDDHGASSTLALDHLVTNAASSANPIGGHGNGNNGAVGGSTSSNAAGNAAATGSTAAGSGGALNGKPNSQGNSTGNVGNASGTVVPGTGPCTTDASGQCGESLSGLLNSLIHSRKK